ncbi:MAG: glutathione S-transferase [Gammaproteobacteria bacterium]|nr:glutathione S-transferase [Gammaproteobacteria bacterium]
MFTIYYAHSTAAIAPQILLEESGANYESRCIDFSNRDQQSPEYLAINPKGRVPALITPRGTLTEVPALLAYIAQIYPEKNLEPTDPFEFAEAQEFNAYLCSTVHVAHAHKMRGSRWSNDPSSHESMRAKVVENLEECARVIESHYFKGPWVMGENYSLCDPYLYLISRWLEGDGVDIAQFQKIKNHRDNMLARPATQTIIALHA